MNTRVYPSMCGETRGTAKVVLRTRFIKRIDIDGTDGVMMVAQSKAGYLEGYTIVPASARYLQKQREGWLIYGRAK